MAIWSVLVEARSPDEGETLAEDDPRIGRFFDLLWPEYGGAVSAGGLYWSARISVDVDDLLEVFPTAVTVVEKAAGHAGLPDWAVVRAELVTDDELQMQLEVPNFPLVMGTAEVVERLGVSRQRLTELRASGRFPEPIRTLAATPIWLSVAVDAFVERWDRRPGRRPAAVVEDALAGYLRMSCGHLIDPKVLDKKKPPGRGLRTSCPTCGQRGMVEEVLTSSIERDDPS